jgi:tRNA threonylcarbamoyl adenosine modification protein YeaZ
VAILHNGNLVAEVNETNNMKHAELIGNAIVSVLAEAKIKPAQVTKVVVGRGPAPFTGLRVGIAAAVMFAEGAKAAIFGAVSLDAIALAAIQQTPLGSETLLVTSDARRGELYWALYRGTTRSGMPIRVEGPAVAKPNDLEEELENRGYKNSAGLMRTQAPLTAANLARLIEGHVLDGHSLEDQSGADLSPLYLREPDATAPKRNALYGQAVKLS